MAWDALASRFQKQRTEEDKGLAQEARTVGGSGGSVGYNPQANPTGGFGGSAGSASSGPVSSSFVNFADLYSANEDKAKSMASNVYRGAEAKAEGAKNSLDAARNQFQGKMGAGTGKGPIGGAHGTRIEDFSQAKDPAVQAEFKKRSERADPTGSGGMPWTAGQHESDKPASEASVKDGSYMDWGDTGEPYVAYKGASPTTAGASRYSGLYGGQLDAAMKRPDQAGLADYHHSATTLDAKSGAGQDYTGPESLKDSMGEEAYAALIKQFSDAEQSVKGLGSAGGVAEALGYAGDESGSAALDAGLTQTAGQSNFKRLADRYSGLGKEVATAQSDSLADVGRADAASDASAGAWQSMVDEYEAANAPEPEPEKQREEKKAGSGFQPYDGDGNPTTANALLEESGYSLSELNDISGELTPEERAYLYKTSGAMGTIYGFFAGTNDDDAMLKQNILAKLAAARARKQGGG